MGVRGAVLPVCHGLDLELDPGEARDGVRQVLAVALVLVVPVQLLPPDGLPEHHVGLLQDRGHDVLLCPENGNVTNSVSTKRQSSFSKLAKLTQIFCWKVCI